MSQPPRATEPSPKFPPYVPQRVREYVAGLFETRGLRPEHADTLRRLTGIDPRMRDAWARLARIARTDEDYVLFVLAAWWARDDYGEWRERTRQAGELARRIAETARGKLCRSGMVLGVVDDLFPISQTGRRSSCEIGDASSMRNDTATRCSTFRRSGLQTGGLNDRLAGSRKCPGCAPSLFGRCDSSNAKRPARGFSRNEIARSVVR